MAADDEDMKEWAKSRDKGDEDEDDDAPPASDAPEGDEPEEDEAEGTDSEGSMSPAELDELAELVRKNLDLILEAVADVDVDTFTDTGEELDDDASDQVLRDLEGMTPELADELEGISEEDAVAVVMEVRDDIAEKVGSDDDKEIDEKSGLVAAFLFRAGELV